jgi:hypothetical protein
LTASRAVAVAAVAADDVNDDGGNDLTLPTRTARGLEAVGRENADATVTTAVEAADTASPKTQELHMALRRVLPFFVRYLSI